MTLYPTSIRGKLTLTAVSVMGVLFILLGGVVQVAGRAQIMSNVDVELSKRVDDVILAQKKAAKFMRPPPGEGRGDRGPDGQGPGPDFGPGGGPDGRPPQDGGGGQGPNGAGQGDNQRGDPNRPNNGNRPPGPRINAFRQALKEIGNHLLAIGPRFIAVDPGPPFAPPDMMEAYDKTVIPKAIAQGIAFSDVVIDGQKVRIITKLAKESGGHRWLAQVPYPLGDVDQSLKTLNQTLLLLLPFGLLLTAVASLFLIKRVMQPIRQISTTADSISAEDLSGRLEVSGSDEFAQLGGTINGMLARLENAFEIQRQTLQRLEVVLKQQRRFTADASHELKTPLAVIKANTGLLKTDKALSEDTRGLVDAVDSAATRMNRLVQGLMLLARTESSEVSKTQEPFDLKIAVQNAIDQVHQSPLKSVNYVDEDPDVYVRGVERDVERVFVNLVDNACRHTPEDGNINVKVEHLGTDAVVTVADNGEGVSAEHLPHLFDRFYRADSARSSDTGGTGLGLAICKGIVESTGGSISVTSELGKGTQVTVRFPLANLS